MGRREGDGVRGAVPSPVSRRREKMPSGSLGDRCVLRLASRAQAQSGARTAPPRNARGQAQARTRAIRAGKGSAAGGPEARNGCERRDPCRRREAGQAGRKPRRPCPTLRLASRAGAIRRANRAAAYRARPGAGAHARDTRGKGFRRRRGRKNETAAKGGTHAEDAKPEKPDGNPGAPARKRQLHAEKGHNICTTRIQNMTFHDTSRQEAEALHDRT